MYVLLDGCIFSGFFCSLVTCKTELRKHELPVFTSPATIDVEMSGEKQTLVSNASETIDSEVKLPAVGDADRLQVGEAGILHVSSEDISIEDLVVVRCVIPIISKHILEAFW